MSGSAPVGYFQQESPSNPTQPPSQPPTSVQPSVLSPKMPPPRTITPIERENVHLFARLIDSYPPGTVLRREGPENEELFRLALDMRGLLYRVGEALTALEASDGDRRERGRIRSEIIL